MGRIARWLLGWALLACTMGAAGAADAPATAGNASHGSVLLMTIDGAIGPASADYVHRALGAAAKQGAALAVLQIDTPGGLDTAMRAIIKDILASPVPVAGFVAPGGARAASAGTYILYASHIAAMTPASNLGAATPVAIGMPGPGAAPESPPAKASDAASGAHAGDPMTAKRLADASAYIRSLAQLRGRNAEWAEKAVRESVSLSASEALEQNVVTLVARDVPDLLAQVDGREVRAASRSLRLATRDASVVPFEPDWRTRLLSVITDPSLALILMMVGIYGLLFEFSSPGLVLPGVVGGISLLLALFAFQMLPVNYAGLALILLGVALLVGEAFVPSGALGVGGVAALAIGAVLLIDSEAPGFGISPALIAGVTIVSAGFILVVAGMAAKARRRPVVSGESSMLGATGALVEFTAGEGWASVRGEPWRVRGSTALAVGQTVRVVAVQGNTLEVAPAEGQAKGG